MARLESRSLSSISRPFIENVLDDLFEPLLLFFSLGFLVPILRVEFEFSHVIYQDLTIYLLVPTGWHGGEELAKLDSGVLSQALRFTGVGFVTNFVFGVLAYSAIRIFTEHRRVDVATVVRYYDSESAVTFATCVCVLNGLVASGHPEFKYPAYMLLMLAVMKILGCLVAPYLVSRLRESGMDAHGSMPDEVGFDPNAITLNADSVSGVDGSNRNCEPDHGSNPRPGRPKRNFSPDLLHEVFLDPRLFLLFGGIIIGFMGKKQGSKVVELGDPVFLNVFQGLLCLFLLEMGITASRKLKDLKRGDIPFIMLGILMPIVFSTFGIAVAQVFSLAIDRELSLGTYVLFPVLFGAASYIAVPAVPRLTIPEAGPTLPLAASLNLTFTFNVDPGNPDAY